MRTRAAWLVVLALCAPALGADPEVSRLLERAEFWRERQRDDLAREELVKVFRLAPEHPEALALLARLQLAANQDRDAAATLDRLRAAHPKDPAVAQIAALLRIRGADREKLQQARQLARAGRHDEAVKAFRALFPGGFPDDDLALEYAQSLMWTREGRDAGGKLIAELARKHPDDPRYQVALVTDLSTRKPVAAATFRMMRDLAAVGPVSRQAREAWRRALLALDPVPESLPPLREYLALNAGDTAVQEKLEQVTRGIAQARRVRDDPGFRAKRAGKAALEAGRDAEAEPLLQRAVELHPDDGEALAQLGVLRMRQSRHAEAIELFQRAQRLDAAGRETWVRLERVARYWSLLQQASAAREIGAYDAAEARVREAMALDPAEPEAKAALQRIEEGRRAATAGALRERAKALEAQGRKDEAVPLLEQAQAADPSSPWIVHDLARLYAERGDKARGDALFKALRERRPDDMDVRYAQALYLSSVDRDADALATLATIPATRRSEGMKTLEERIQLAAEGRKRDERRREAQALLDASRAAQREGDVDRAVALEQQSVAIEPTSEGWRVRRLAELRDQQLAWFGGAFDALRRSGTPGQSQLDAQELPLGYRSAWGRGGRSFFRVSPARISSGTLDFNDSYGTVRYGALALCHPDCLVQPAPSREKGVGLMAGSQAGDFRLDLGTTPIGFPIVNLVGGAVYDGRIGEVSYSIELARRAVVSSLLSYAGAKDPYTGRTWGGVTSNGVRVNLSHDRGETYGVWALAGVYRLVGRDVRQNDKGEAMAGGYRRFVNEENRQLAMGLTAMYWTFSDEAGQFTFGHGGYYSPKQYISLSLPVTFAARSADTSFYVRGSVSASRSKSHTAPFFPTDPALQAQADARSVLTGLVPFYAGGYNGHSYGRSFAAALEHRLDPNLFVGARLEIERSTNYTPNRLLIYVRWSPTGSVSSRMNMPPEPVVLPGFQY